MKKLPTMAELAGLLNEKLEIHRFKSLDYGPNGAQVDLSNQVPVLQLATAVSSSLQVIEMAVKIKAQVLLVHHGLFWNHQKGLPLTGPHGKRVRTLIENKMGLLAYHLPLDAHLELGNAAQLAKRLGLGQLAPFGPKPDFPLGVRGHFKQALGPVELQALVAKSLGLQRARVWCSSAGKLAKIKSLGIITGGANREWKLALDSGLDAYLTGEMSEYDFHDAKEAGLTMLACGHHASEKYGVQALGEMLGKRFPGMKVTFLDEANPC